jgi:hypothetical protein
MFVSRGLVGPKVHRNSSASKGKQVNIPVPSVCSRKALTLRGMLSGTVVPSKRIIPRSTAMVRNGRKRDGGTRQIPGAHEKGDGRPYREPTQVPLAEEVKACRSNCVKGTRQIGPVT